MSYSRDPTIPGLKHLPSIPYRENASRLQTLDLWLPDPQPTTTTGTWLIYIHGGAWRDPTQDSLCVLPTLRSLFTQHTSLFSSAAIAGIASLNYRLSPYPSHATQPSAPDDGDRNVRHPAHVSDVKDALEYVIETYAVERWVGVGHSCGATLLGQVPLVSSTSTATEQIRKSLKALVLIAGIYDLPSFVSNHTPPTCSEEVAGIYRTIVEGAFGTDERVWQEVSPARFSGEALWAQDVVLGYSSEDALVEVDQREKMLQRYFREGWGPRTEDDPGHEAGTKKVDVKDLAMGHDEVWEDGTQIAALIDEVVRRVGSG
ncbi:alpha/beta-hydrolase [Bimuria novae-zelandiae CBS 107.79]|uniref:Kynurenine formamidase n=1 Tax=Bimuria novae-zelandiae CBS 107.79 TaxID=1447943 RepID=A0A6A5VCY9_9PLEO|nr:alpha/beta-hydrolase [Bimuria novae-zelandiae CBS 107.79]